MNPNTSSCGPDTASSPAELSRDIRRHLALCEEAMEMTMCENQALAGANYEPFGFYQRRKELLPRLERSLDLLRFRRKEWQRLSPLQRAGGEGELSALMQTAQGLLMKVLMLDRENQQALLRRGLVPAQHLPATAAQQPHCVADLYRRHSLAAARPA